MTLPTTGAVREDELMTQQYRKLNDYEIISAGDVAGTDDHKTTCDKWIGKQAKELNDMADYEKTGWCVWRPQKETHDETCPHCQVHIVDLSDIFTTATDCIEMDCPKCDKPIVITRIISVDYVIVG